MSKNGLTYGMAFLFLISFVLLGLIVVKEKKVSIMLPRVEVKMKDYIEENLKDLDQIRYEKTKYNETEKRFEKKVISTKNKNLYFYLYYKKKRITSTYEEDYQKGKSLLSHLEKEMTKDTEEENIKITIDTPLDQFSNEVKELLLKEENLKSLKIYTLEKEMKVSSFTEEEILLELTKLVLQNQKNGISPKNYTLTITNSSDVTQSIKIENLILPNTDIREILKYILKNDKTIETKYNIKYNYLN